MTTAIITKWLGPTNHRGSRVKASAGWGDYHRTLTVGWNYALGVEANHRNAALALAKKLGWSGPWTGGEIETGYVFVRSFNGGI